MEPDPLVRELLQRRPDPAEYAEIPDLGKRHSIAEGRRDLPGLISTLTADCHYQVYPGSHAWHGHDGARRFYTKLLTAFPDITSHSGTSSSVHRVSSRRPANEWKSPC